MSEKTVKAVAFDERRPLREVYRLCEEGHIDARRMPGIQGHWRIRVDNDGHPIRRQAQAA